jgi:hypothetical protein
MVTRLRVDFMRWPVSKRLNSSRARRTMIHDWPVKTEGDRSAIRNGQNQRTPWTRADITMIYATDDRQTYVWRRHD